MSDLTLQQQYKSLLNDLIIKAKDSVEFIREFSFKNYIAINAGAIISLLAYISQGEPSGFKRILACTAIIFFTLGLLSMLFLIHDLVNNIQPKLKSDLKFYGKQQIELESNFSAAKENVDNFIKTKEQEKTTEDDRIKCFLNFSFIMILFGTIFGLIIILGSIF